ncbi:MAG: methyltransferase domain-containing protein [Crocinitomicaceae bacterium]|nr:methyltransferase domain-containing protein [Crocinitomicaceae bacterium]
MANYVQYGCGLSAPNEWVNFDSSPSLRIQRNPLLNIFLGRKTGVRFPKEVRYGDIVKGLPVEENSCDGLYCSHVLEHLALNDFRTALQNSYVVLKPGGTFRMLMPDLEVVVNQYITNKEQGDLHASEKFIRSTHMGKEIRERGLKASFVSMLGNSKHLWLWDHASAIEEFEKVGFKNIRKCEFNDSSDKMFLKVESEERFKGAIALEMTK